MTSEAQVPDLPTLRDLYIKDRMIKGPFGTAAPETEFLAPPPPDPDSEGRKAWFTRRNDLQMRLIHQRRGGLNDFLFPKATTREVEIKAILKGVFRPVASLADYQDWLRRDPQCGLHVVGEMAVNPNITAFFTFLEAIPSRQHELLPWMGGLIIKTQGEELFGYIPGGHNSFYKEAGTCAWIRDGLEWGLTRQVLIDDNGDQSPAWQILKTRLEAAIRQERETAQKDFDQAVAVSPDGTAIIKPNLIVVQGCDQWYELHFNRPCQTKETAVVKMVELTGHMTRRIKANATAERLQQILREEITRREETDSPKIPILLVFQDGYQVYIPTQPQKRDGFLGPKTYESLTLVGDKRFLPWTYIPEAPSNGWILGMDWPNGIAAWTSLPLDDNAWWTAKRVAEQAARELKPESAAPTET